MKAALWGNLKVHSTAAMLVASKVESTATWKVEQMAETKAVRLVVYSAT